MQVWPRGRIVTHLSLAASLGFAAGLLCVLAEQSWLVTVGVGLAVATGAGWLGTARYIRRRRMISTPFPDGWRAILDRRVDFYRQLDPDARARFETDVRIFIAEQRIYSVEGSDVVDDEIRLLIASSAATLGHGIPDFEWPRLRDIVVYPRSFDDEYRQDGSDPNIAGMVHTQGPILYSAKDLRLGFRRTDGHNVGIHELAHVLDMADGSADGVPVGAAWASSAPWLAVVTDRFKKVQSRRKQGRSPLRDYAGTNEAEFFAVAVESFFERPHELAEQDAELYGMLRAYFGQDPAGRERRRDGRKYR